MTLEARGQLEYDSLRLVTLIDILIDQLKLPYPDTALDRGALLADAARKAAVSLSEQIQKEIHEDLDNL